jgi:hypothetical protein
MRTQKFRFLFTAGLLLSAAVYVRPIAFYLPVVASVFIFAISISEGKSTRWSALRSLVFVAICAVLIGAWNVRNSRSADYSGFSSVSDYNLYFYQAASVLAAERGVPYYTVRQQLGAENPAVYYENHPEQRQWTRGEVSSYMRREAMRVLLRHPFLYAEIHLKGVLRMMLDPGGVEYLKLFKLYPQSGGLLGRIVDQGLTRTLMSLRKELPSVFWSTALLGTILIFYWLAASVGACLAWRSYTAELIVVLTLVLYFVVVSGGPNSLERFRHPVMPMVCLLAGYALSRLCTKNPGRS